MKKENTFVSAAKRGFTLVELLVVVAIIGLLATAAVVALPSMLSDASETSAQQQVRVFAQGVTRYQMKNRNRLPQSLEALVEGDDPILEGGTGVLVDPWGTNYELRKNGKRFYVVSAGIDCQFDTEDDIRSDRVRQVGQDENK